MGAIALTRGERLTNLSSMSTPLSSVREPSPSDNPNSVLLPATAGAPLSPLPPAYTQPGSVAWTLALAGSLRRGPASPDQKRASALLSTRRKLPFFPRLPPPPPPPPRPLFGPSFPPPPRPPLLSALASLFSTPGLALGASGPRRWAHTCQHSAYEDLGRSAP